MLSADLDPALADLLGVRYEDKKVLKGTSYIYRLALIKGSKEETIAFSLPVTPGNPVIYPPPMFQGKGADSRILLRWKREDRFSAYEIYRSGTKNGRYKKINKAPVIIVKTYDKKGNIKYPEWLYTDNDLDNG